jgi:NAD(P)-dependent dehydrogenase (short-subunit alcohol dehydrogenase family)
MFDVNVFGALRMIRAVAPHMRQQGAGRIINLSSIAGRLATPVNGAYSASKFAVEALSDSLRWELAPFGIQVVLIEPGSIKTHFLDTAQAHTQAIFANSTSPYQALYQHAGQVTAGMSRQAPGPEAVSGVIRQAIEAPRPQARYLVAVDLPGRSVLHLGASVWDLVVRQMFKIGPAAE